MSCILALDTFLHNDLSYCSWNRLSNSYPLGLYQKWRRQYWHRLRGCLSPFCAPNDTSFSSFYVFFFRRNHHCLAVGSLRVGFKLTFSDPKRSKSSLDNRHNLPETLTKLCDWGDCPWGNGYLCRGYSKRVGGWLWPQRQQFFWLICPSYRIFSCMALSGPLSKVGDFSGRIKWG